jgi:hypothetical protein
MLHQYMVENLHSPGTSVDGGEPEQSWYISTWWRTWTVLLHQYMVEKLDSPGTSVDDR